MVLFARMVPLLPVRRLAFRERDFDRTWKIHLSTGSRRERTTHTSPPCFPVESSSRYRAAESAPKDLPSSFDARRFASAQSYPVPVVAAARGYCQGIFRSWTERRWF